MSQEVETLVAAALPVLQEMEALTASFATALAEAAPDDTDRFVARREELLRELGALDEQIRSASFSAADGPSSLYVSYRDRRNGVVAEVIKRDDAIVERCSQLLASVSEEMAALQTGRKAMTGYRQGGLPGTFVNRTA